MEGGWPKDINKDDGEQTQRYRRKIEKDELYIHTMLQILPVFFLTLFIRSSYISYPSKQNKNNFEFLALGAYDSAEQCVQHLRAIFRRYRTDSIGPANLLSYRERVS